MKMQECKCVIKSEWIKSTVHKFNDISIGKIFRERNDCIVVAHEDGVLRTYQIPVKPAKDASQLDSLKCLLSLESKGGPIQRVAVHDVSRLGSKDVVVTDSRGIVTVFSNEQILTRRTVSQSCIQTLHVQQDKLGNQAILTGDANGHIVAFSLYADLWHLRLYDVPQLKGLNTSIAVTCVRGVRLSTRHGQCMEYVLAADTARHVFLIQQGSIQAMFTLPDIITAMTSGKFIGPQCLENGDNNAAFDYQVALASDSGAIYIFTNFQVYQEEFGNVELPIRHLQTLPAEEGQSTDSLLCAGNFNTLFVLREGKTEASYDAGSWITSVVLAEGASNNSSGVNGAIGAAGDNANNSRVLIGCQDNSIHSLNVSFW